MSQTVESSQHPKVLVLVHEEGYGGGGRQSFYILEQLAALRAPAVLVTNSASGWLGSHAQTLSGMVSCHFVPSIQRALNPLKDLWVLLSLIFIFMQEKPDVVVCAGVKLVGLGSLAAWITRVPQKIVIIRGQGGAPGSRMIRLIFAMDKLVAQLGVRFITVCDYDRQEMLAQGVCAPESILTVHNGTDLKRFETPVQPKLRSQFNIPKNAFAIGMVGRLSNQKRYDEFIEMMAILCKRYSYVYGFLIGEGETRNALQQHINIRGLSNRVFITGFIQEMPAIYADLDLSVLFTRYEGCANALVESIAAGLPCIADAVCGNPEIIHHEENGFIVPPHQVALAAEYASQLIDSSELRATMGQKARQIAHAGFNRERQMAQLIGYLTAWPQPRAVQSDPRFHQVSDL